MIQRVMITLDYDGTIDVNAIKERIMHSSVLDDRPVEMILIELLPNCSAVQELKKDILKWRPLANDSISSEMVIKLIDKHFGKELTEEK